MHIIAIYIESEMRALINQAKNNWNKFYLPDVSCEVAVEVDDKCSSLMLSISDFMMLLSEKINVLYSYTLKLTYTFLCRTTINASFFIETIAMAWLGLKEEQFLFKY